MISGKNRKYLLYLSLTANFSDPTYLPYTRGQLQQVWIQWPSNLNPQASETGNRNMLGYVRKIFFLLLYII